jgi:hypothetical protein
MKKTKTIITVGIISLLLLLFLTGCGTESLKSSQNTSQEATVAEDGSSEAADMGVTGEEATTDETSEEAATDGSSGEAAEDEASPEPTENPETNCSSLNPHPMAEGMVEQFDVTYDEVMTWYCDGAAFSDILLALETEQLVDQTPEELLSMLEDSTWEEIWVELGVEK